MKSLTLISACIILIFSEGCGTSKMITKKDYALRTKIIATIGSTMLSYVSAKTDIYNSSELNKGTKEEFVYTGISGNTIKIDYRQYYIYNGDWYIEDGFPLHLEYDLSLGDSITCRYYRLWVLAADNNEIKFMVIKD
jgi:hypothetical protein